MTSRNYCSIDMAWWKLPDWPWEASIYQRCSYGFTAARESGSLPENADVDCTLRRLTPLLKKPVPVTQPLMLMRVSWSHLRTSWVCIDGMTSINRHAPVHPQVMQLISCQMPRGEAYLKLMLQHVKEMHILHCGRTSPNETDKRLGCRTHIDSCMKLRQVPSLLWHC